LFGVHDGGGEDDGDHEVAERAHILESFAGDLGDGGVVDEDGGVDGLHGCLGDAGVEFLESGEAFDHFAGAVGDFEDAVFVAEGVEDVADLFACFGGPATPMRRTPRAWLSEGVAASSICMVV